MLSLATLCYATGPGMGRPLTAAVGDDGRNGCHVAWTPDGERLMGGEMADGDVKQEVGGQR
jgi:hypothetical protein